MNGTLTLRLASVEELRIFYDWMRRQFHAGELKPLEEIERLRSEGRYCAYGLWEGETLMAYALFSNTADGRAHLLDYYAVLPEFQDAGWGSEFLQQLRGRLTGTAILLEVEDPAYAPDEAERAHFSRRIRFYERNGCLHTKIELNLFGFDYVIMTLPLQGEMEEARIRAALEEIYHGFFPPEYYNRFVRFRDGRTS